MAASGQKMSPLMVVGLIVAMGLSFYMMFEYVGPFQWLAELQLRWFGSYSEKLTFLFTFLAIWLGLALVMLPIRLWFGGPSMFSTGKAAAGATTATDSRPGNAVAGIIVALVGLGFVGVAGWKVYRAQHAGSLTPVGVEHFEAGKAPPSLWVKVKGYPVNGRALVFEKSHSSDKFVPIISGRDDPHKVGVHVFLKVKPDVTVAAGGYGGGPGEYEGMLFRNDLPGALRVDLERENVLKGDHYVLEWGQTPEKEAHEGKIMAIIGGSIAGIGALLALFLGLRRPKATQVGSASADGIITP
jgi:hypothetical protein